MGHASPDRVLSGTGQCPLPIEIFIRITRHFQLQYTLTSHAVYSIHVIMSDILRNSHHYDIPHRCRVKGVFDYFSKKQIQLSRLDKHEIFRIMGASRSREYEILKDFDRTRRNDSNTSDLRDTDTTLTDAQVIQVDKLLEDRYFRNLYLL